VSSRLRAIGAILLALGLVVVVVVASSTQPRRWHVVLVDLAPARIATDEPGPRLDALARSGAVAAWPGAGMPPSAQLLELSGGLAASGWLQLEPPVEPSLSSALRTEEVLAAVYDRVEAGGGRLVLSVTYQPASRTEADLEVGRLVDGLAGPLPGSQTLYVILDRDLQRVLLVGPDAAPRAVEELPASPDDFAAWILDLLRVRDE